MIINKMLRINKPMFVDFVDLKNTFDGVYRSKLLNSMETIGINYIDRRYMHI